MLFGFRVSPDRFCIGEHQLLLMLCELLRIFQRLHLPKAGGKIGVWHVGAIEQMRLVHVSQQQFQLLLSFVAEKDTARKALRLNGFAVLRILYFCFSALFSSHFRTPILTY